MGLGAAFNVVDWVFKRVDQVSGWIKGKVRRDRVNKMEDDLRSGDIDSIRRRLRRFKQSVKDRERSR